MTPTRDLAGSNGNLDRARRVYRNVVDAEASTDFANALAANIEGGGTIGLQSAPISSPC